VLPWWQGNIFPNCYQIMQICLYLKNATNSLALNCGEVRKMQQVKELIQVPEAPRRARLDPMSLESARKIFGSAIQTPERSFDRGHCHAPRTRKGTQVWLR